MVIDQHRQCYRGKYVALISKGRDKDEFIQIRHKTSTGYVTMAVDIDIRRDAISLDADFIYQTINKALIEALKKAKERYREFIETEHIRLGERPDYTLLDGNNPHARLATPYFERYM